MLEHDKMRKEHIKAQRKRVGERKNAKRMISKKKKNWSREMLETEIHCTQVRKVTLFPISLLRGRAAIHLGNQYLEAILMIRELHNHQELF